jgi:hypothetical protein
MNILSPTLNGQYPVFFFFFRFASFYLAFFISLFLTAEGLIEA